MESYGQLWPGLAKIEDVIWEQATREFLEKHNSTGTLRWRTVSRRNRSS
jgi:hypothetical protein